MQAVSNPQNLIKSVKKLVIQKLIGVILKVGFVPASATIVRAPAQVQLTANVEAAATAWIKPSVAMPVVVGVIAQEAARPHVPLVVIGTHLLAQANILLMKLKKCVKQKQEMSARADNMK